VIRIFILLIVFLSFKTILAQSVGIGTSTPDPSARLQISSSTQGILLPALTAAQRGAINNPATGLLVFQTDENAGFYFYLGGNWINLTTGYAANVQATEPSRHYGFTFTLAGGIDRGDMDGQGVAAAFFFPAGLALDAAGNVYVADQKNDKIRKITPTGFVSTFAGTGDPGLVDGPRNLAQFSSPNDVAVDGAGNVYVADGANNRVRKIATDGQVTTLAGSGRGGFADGSGDIARFDGIEGIAVDAQGNVYVADLNNHRIRKVAPDGTVSTVAGSSTFGSTDGHGDIATFKQPSDIALDVAGNIYVADQGNHKIRKITPARQVSTYAGTGDAGLQDGPAASATFNILHGIAVDSYGNVYVSDRLNNRIRKISPALIVSTLAGTGSPGAVDGARAVVSFLQPLKLATDASGDVYVADFINHKIRKIIIQ
jgi:hypothetical protein